VIRLVPLLVLALLASSCGGDSGSSDATTVATTSAAATTTAVNLTPAEAHAAARKALQACQAAIEPITFTTVTKTELATVKTQVTKAKTACNQGPKLRQIAQAMALDDALAQSSAAETALAEGVGNFEKYLVHVENGTNGKTIFAYSMEQVRQAKLLLAEALAELK
jgi:hypothetical protein